MRQIDFHKLDREEEEAKEEEPVDATDKGDKLEIDKVEKGPSENKDKARMGLEQVTNLYQSTAAILPTIPPKWPWSGVVDEIT